MLYNVWVAVLHTFCAAGTTRPKRSTGFNWRAWTNRTARNEGIVSSGLCSQCFMQNVLPLGHEWKRWSQGGKSNLLKIKKICS